METIIVTNFAVESQAYQAFSDLKNSMVNPLSSISQAALVSKVDGQVKILDEVDNSSNDETIVGGIVGGLIGMLAGPIGLLFGGAIGAFAGAAIDDNADDNESLLIEQVMQDITCADGVTLVAFGTEQVDRFYDDIMAKFESRTTRYDASEVRDKMNLANQMQEDFQREAREQIKAKKKARHNQVKDHFTNDATKDDK